MLNRERTKEKFGYDLNSDKKSRRSKADYTATGAILKKHLMVIDNCPSCNLEREIQYRASLKDKLCSKCFHNSPEMIAAKQNQTKIKTEEHKQKMKDNHWSKNGHPVPFKGMAHTEETKTKLRANQKEQFSNYSKEQVNDFRIKASCTRREILVSEFTGFVAPEANAIRGSIEGKAWKLDVLSKANFTCVKCGYRGGSLVAHHKNAFNAFPEQRFDIENGACLCQDCHLEFHSKYGKGDNTERQFNEWYIGKKPTIYMVCGASGSGKSWVCRQLTDMSNYISYDENSKKKHIDLLKGADLSRPTLYDPPIKISTFIKRHSHEFDIIPVFIIEDTETVKERILSRGGEWTDFISKRCEAMKKRNAKYGVFSGTSQEVLDWLKKQLTPTELCISY
jgi:Zn ribbon nucleic-acid-binding protein